MPTFRSERYAACPASPDRACRISVLSSRDHPGSKHFKLDGILRIDLVSNQCPLSATCPKPIARPANGPTRPLVRRPLPGQRPLWVLERMRRHSAAIERYGSSEYESRGKA